VQKWFESLWNSIQQWVDEAKKSISNKITESLTWFNNTYISPLKEWINSSVVGQLFSITKRLENLGDLLYKSYILPGLQWLQTAVWDFAVKNWEKYVQPAFKWITDSLFGVRDFLWKNVIEPAWNFLSSKVGDVWKYITGEIWPKLVATYEDMKSRFDWVYGKLTEAWNSTMSSIANVENYISASFKEFISSLTAPLTSLQSWFSNADKNVFNVFSFVVSSFLGTARSSFESVLGIGKALVDAIVGAAGNAAGSAPGIYSSLSGVGSSIGSVMNDSVLRPLAEQLNSSSSEVHKSIGLSSPQNIWVSALSPLAPMLGAYIALGLAAKAGEGIGDTNVEAATFGIRPGFAKVIAGLDVRGLVESVMTGYVTGLAMAYFSGTVMEQVRRESLEAGRPIPPSVVDAATMLRRGAITEDLYLKAVKRAGLMKEYEEGYKELVKQIPGPRDIISFFVRESYAPKFEATYPEKFQEYPTEFGEWMKKVGYDEFWAKSYWAAHWQLPSIEQVLTMLWRGLISLDATKAFLKEADIDPRWRDRLIDIAYRLPGRIEARWGLEWGLWDEEKFMDFLKAEGMHPDYVSDVYAIEKKNVFREHINAVMNAELTRFKNGFITKEQFLQTLEKLGFPEDVRTLRAWQADILADNEIKEKAVAATLTEYREDKINEQQLRDILSSIIVDPAKLEQIIRIEVARKQKRAVVPPTMKTEAEQMKESLLKLEMRIADVKSDIEHAQKARDAEFAIWEKKIEDQQALVEAEVKPERKAAQQRKLELLLLQYEKSKVYWENKIAELQETLGFLEQEAELLRSRSTALSAAA
jgi:hypothetical protein